MPKPSPLEGVNPVARHPRVSGIIAARNAALFLDEAIESALRQTFTDFELLVVDDASTDGTAELIEGYARLDTRVRLLRLTECKGQCVARNLAMNEARGEWIAVLDADDLWRPTRLECQLAALEKNPEACLVTSDFQSISHEGNLLEISTCPWPEWWLRWRLLFCNSLGGHSQVLFRKDMALACGGYREDRRLAEDYQLWVDLAARGGFAYAPGVQMNYRQHEQSDSSVHQKTQRTKARAISAMALGALLGEEWAQERLAHLQDFWQFSLSDSKVDVRQMARDLRKVEDVFWSRHPEWKTPENRNNLAWHTGRHWKYLAAYFQEKGLRSKALVASWFGFICGLERLQLRFASGPQTAKPVPIAPKGNAGVS